MTLEELRSCWSFPKNGPGDENSPFSCLFPEARLKSRNSRKILDSSLLCFQVWSEEGEKWNRDGSGSPLEPPKFNPIPKSLTENWENPKGKAEPPPPDPHWERGSLGNVGVKSKAVDGEESLKFRDGSGFWPRNPSFPSTSQVRSTLPAPWLLPWIRNSICASVSLVWKTLQLPGFPGEEERSHSKAFPRGVSLGNASSQISLLPRPPGSSAGSLGMRCWGERLDGAGIGKGIPVPGPRIQGNQRNEENPAGS